MENRHAIVPIRTRTGIFRRDRANRFLIWQVLDFSAFFGVEPSAVQTLKGTAWGIFRRVLARFLGKNIKFNKNIAMQTVHPTILRHRL